MRAGAASGPFGRGRGAGGAVVGVSSLQRRPTSDPPELARYAGEWPAPNHDAAGTRAAAGSRIDAANVRRLRLAWRFRFSTQPGLSGIYASTPLVLGGRVYLQDLNSNVYALDEATGRLLWRKRFAQRNGGPNGLAAGYGRIYGNTSRAAFALDASRASSSGCADSCIDGRRRSTSRRIAANGLVYTSTIGRPPGGRGVIYALDAATGRVRWTFDTILGTWAVPAEAAGGGAWWPLSRRSRTRVRRQLESISVGRHAAASERRRVPRPRALHGLAARARRPKRKAGLVRPGHPARRARLRPRGLADRRPATDATSSTAPGRADRCTRGTARRDDACGRGPSACTETIAARYPGTR